MASARAGLGGKLAGNSVVVLAVVVSDVVAVVVVGVVFGMGGSEATVGSVGVGVGVVVAVVAVVAVEARVVCFGDGLGLPARAGLAGVSAGLTVVLERAAYPLRARPGGIVGRLVGLVVETVGEVKVNCLTV